jgi:hypothetical protein
MLSSFIRVQTKHKTDETIVPVIQTTKKPVRKRKAKQIKQANPDDDELDYSKFTPLKQPKNTVKHYEDDEEDDGLFSTVPEDEKDFEDENDVYKKQDMEWAEIMKEAGEVTAVEDDSETSSVLEEDISTHISTDIEESPYGSGLSSPSDIHSPSFGGDDEFFSSKPVKSLREPREKPVRVFSGVALSSDDDYIP